MTVDMDMNRIRTRFKPFQSPYWENLNPLDPTAVQLNYFSAVNSPPKPHGNCWRSLRTCTTLHKLTCASNQTSCLSCVLIRCIKYSPKMEALWRAKSPANRLWVWQATWPWLLNLHRSWWYASCNPNQRQRQSYFNCLILATVQNKNPILNSSDQKIGFVMFCPHR